MEVECKAWVRDRGAVLAALKKIAGYAGSYVKHDIYFFDPARESDPANEVRLRDQAGSWIVTFKDKSIADGIEVNNEHEFTVSDGFEFAALLSRLGIEEKRRKVKRGELYRMGEISVELSEVEGLGLFVEAEMIVDEPLSVARAREEVRSVISRLGIPDSDIEPRYYVDMLAEREKGSEVF